MERIIRFAKICFISLVYMCYIALNVYGMGDF